MDNTPQTLQSLFADAKAQKKALESATDTTGPAYQEQLSRGISTFNECQKQISKLSLFSSNESVDDIATGDLQFLTVDYLITELLQRAHSTDRLASLRRIRDEYEKYLESLDQYGLLSQSDKKLYERYMEAPDSFTLAPINDATARRAAKISRFREEKELKQKLDYLSRDKNPMRNDEDIVREVYLAEIKLYTHQTFQSLDMLAQELAMLIAIQSNPPSQRNQISSGPSHRDMNEYSERLDVGLSRSSRGGKHGALLGGNGKPLQPFTLTNRKTDIQKGVFRSGHNLPTMSIDEYLEEERMRGGIIEGGGEQSGVPKDIDPDDFEKADEETIKARAWDEFTEENPKGSGNTLNRG